MTEQLAQWFAQNHVRLEARGIRATYERSPEDARGKRSAWVSAQNDDVTGQIIVWDDGDGQIIGGAESEVEDFDLHEPDDLLAALARFEAIFDRRGAQRPNRGIAP